MKNSSLETNHAAASHHSDDSDHSDHSDHYNSPQSKKEDAANRDRNSGYSTAYPIYKPNARGNGGVLRFDLNRDKGAIFVEGAPQSGEKQFDWDQKIIMKWGLSDLGYILAVLQGRMAEAKLFHQSEKANSACDFIARTDPERAPFYLSISRQENGSKSVAKVGIPLTHPEAAILETALRTAVARIIRW